MPFYLYQIAYSPEAIKAMVANPQDRTAAAAKLIEAIGGKLHHLFFAFGKFDVVCLIEGPDDRMMAAGALAVAAAGTVSRSETVKLLTAAEAKEAMGMASKATAAYKAPMAS
ncbi:GYD domain-containing protein [Amaricoccus sp.]|uniref:GYD domain-containing protein n=1 Tax=Amaricoccus sp. TaxID=1872485 RepID=UPI001B63E4A6|nr:GYD domain-containing protein [Amaricoccus sp.]MBP7240915.1 GYD domain-containing protein [Amaricoccus sp.]